MKHFPFMLFFFCAILGPLFAKDRPDYKADLTENEKANIRFIIITLSQKSGISLLFQKGALERAGDQTRDVHPLHFLCYVFTDPELRLAIQRIRGIAWNRFSKDMSESLARQAKQQNLGTEMFFDFAQKVGIPEPKLDNTSAKELLSFIETVREQIATSATPG